MPLWPQRVRGRLTLWYVGVLILILGAYLAGVSALLFWRMSDVLKRLGEEDLETVKGLLYFQPDGGVAVREDYHHHSDWKQVQERLLEILAPDGRILYRNERLGDRTIGGAPFDGEGVNGYSGRTAKMSDGTAIILISRVYVLQDRPILIRVGYRQDLIWDELKETLLVLLAALPLVLAGTAYAGYRMVGRALDPIGQMASRAEQINSERLNERLPESNPQDELGHLALVFNAMLSRIAQSFEQLRRFTADASHELRTPLAAIRSTGEVALQKKKSADE
jgi:signal transduction histidine kinase